MKWAVTLLIVAMALGLTPVNAGYRPDIRFLNATTGEYRAFTECANIEVKAVAYHSPNIYTGSFKENYLEAEYNDYCGGPSLSVEGNLPDDTLKVTGESIELDVADLLAAGLRVHNDGFVSPVPLKMVITVTNDWRADSATTFVWHDPFTRGHSRFTSTEFSATCTEVTFGAWQSPYPSFGSAVFTTGARRSRSRY